MSEDQSIDRSRLNTSAVRTNMLHEDGCRARGVSPTIQNTFFTDSSNVKPVSCFHKLYPDLNANQG